jgi:hypothetical protein
MFDPLAILSVVVSIGIAGYMLFFGRLWVMGKMYEEETKQREATKQRAEQETKRS